MPKRSRKRSSLAHFRRVTTSSRMSAMWAAGPPKPMTPSFTKRRATSPRGVAGLTRPWSPAAAPAPGAAPSTAPTPPAGGVGAVDGAAPGAGAAAGDHGRVRPATPLGEVALLFVKLGVIGFGGPAAHIALMREEVVTRRK